MNNNDIVKELQTRGYDAELHEVIKNGVSMKGIVIRSNDPMTPKNMNSRRILRLM